MKNSFTFIDELIDSYIEAHDLHWVLSEN